MAGVVGGGRLVGAGRVVAVSDGIATVVGIESVKVGEIVFFLRRSASYNTLEHSQLNRTQNNSIIVRGLVLNLNLNNSFIMVLGNEVFVGEQSLVFRSNHLFNLNTSLRMFGKVLNSLGEDKNGRASVDHMTVECAQYVEKKASGIIDRIPINIPLQTGIKAVDSLVPIGRGQRELIIGDRQTGKTSIAVDAILNYVDMNNSLVALSKNLSMSDLRSMVWFVYAAVGQKQSTVSQIFTTLDNKRASWFTCIIAATAAEPAPMQFLAPYAACTVGEFIRDVVGGHCVIVYDDLTKHAVAYRQMSLLLRRPPGREAFPGDVFYVHSRLLERAGSLRELSRFRINVLQGVGFLSSYSFPRGTLTAFPVIETQAGDVSAYIPTNVISITDGQIFLETELFYRGIRPAISVGLSVSRVGSAAQTVLMKRVTGSLKIDLAQFREVEGFTKLGATLDDFSLRLLIKGENLIEILKQKVNSPLSLNEQLISIFMGVGYSLSWLSSTINFKRFSGMSMLNPVRSKISWFENIRLSIPSFALTDVNLFLDNLILYIKDCGINAWFGYKSSENLITILLSKFPMLYFDDIVLSFLYENSSFSFGRVSRNHNNYRVKLTELGLWKKISASYRLTQNFRVGDCVFSHDGYESNFTVDWFGVSSMFLRSLLMVNIEDIVGYFSHKSKRLSTLFVKFFANKFFSLVLRYGITIAPFFEELLNFFVGGTNDVNGNIVDSFVLKDYINSFYRKDGIASFRVNLIRLLNIKHEFRAPSAFFNFVLNDLMLDKVRNRSSSLKKFLYVTFGAVSRRTSVRSLELLLNTVRFDVFLYDSSKFEDSILVWLLLLLFRSGRSVATISKFLSDTFVRGFEFINSIHRAIGIERVCDFFSLRAAGVSDKLRFFRRFSIRRFVVFLAKNSNSVLTNICKAGVLVCNVFTGDIFNSGVNVNKIIIPFGADIHGRLVACAVSGGGIIVKFYGRGGISRFN